MPVILYEQFQSLRVSKGFAEAKMLKFKKFGGVDIYRVRFSKIQQQQKGIPQKIRQPGIWTLWYDAFGIGILNGKNR